MIPAHHDDRATAPLDAEATIPSAWLRSLAAQFVRTHPDAYAVRDDARTLVTAPAAAALAGLTEDAPRMPSRSRRARARRVAADVLADIRAAADVPAAPALPFSDPPPGCAFATLRREATIATKYGLARALRGLHDLGAPVVLVPHPRTLAVIRRSGLDMLTERMGVVTSLSREQFELIVLRAGILVSDTPQPASERAVDPAFDLALRAAAERIAARTRSRHRAA